MKRLLFILPVIILVSCSHSQTKISGVPTDTIPNLKAFKLTSPAFKQGEYIPSIYTCDSSNISPELHWNKPCDKVVSYALIMDDPDAPMGTWVHWVIYNIPAADTMLPAQFTKDSLVNGTIQQGITSFRNIGYGGPCPPDGTHHYFLRLFALNTIFSLPCKSTGAKTLTAAMKGHIIAVAELMGRYERHGKN